MISFLTFPTWSTARAFLPASHLSSKSGTDPFKETNPPRTTGCTLSNLASSANSSRNLLRIQTSCFSVAQARVQVVTTRVTANEANQATLLGVDIDSSLDATRRHEGTTHPHTRKH